MSNSHPTSNQCGVKGCNNTRDQGSFVGSFCAPCDHDLRTGNFQFGTSVVYEQAREIERLRKLVNDVGTAFTGGNEHCSTCRRIYNALAADQGWKSFPVEMSDRERVNWMVQHFAKQFLKGYTWTSIRFQAVIPIRDQIDEYMRRERAQETS